MLKHQKDAKISSPPLKNQDMKKQTLLKEC